MNTRARLYAVALSAGFLFLQAAGTEAAAVLWAHEPFAYERRQGHVSAEIPGEGIDGLNGGTGWDGPWRSEGTLNSGIPEGEGDFSDGEDYGVTLGARTGPLAYRDAFGNSLDTSGNQVRTAFGNHSWERRNLARPIGELGSTVWMSFLAQAHGDSTATPRWAFVELSQDGGNRAWFGNVTPVASGNWAMQLPDHPEGSVYGDAGDGFRMSVPALYLVRWEFPEDTGDDTRITVWLNPADLVHEQALPRPVFQFATGYSEYNQVGVAGRYSTDFDEIRIGTSFEAVTPVAVSLPDAPALSLGAGQRNVTLSWPVVETGGASLYQSKDLRNWSELLPHREERDPGRTVTLPVESGRRFFRLQTVSPSLPSPRLPNLERSGWEPRMIREGLVFYERRFQDLFHGPQVIQVLALDLDHPDLRLELTATDVWEQTRMPIPEFASHAGAVAAINGGFAPAQRYPEVGYGIMKFRGDVWPFVNDPSFHEAYEALGRNAVGIDGEGGWHFASRGEEGWELGATWDSDWPEMVDAMAGGSHLVREGRVHPLVVPETTRGAYLEDDRLHRLTFNRHPRTAIGITENRIAVLATIAGRFPGIAEGMTLQEVARFMLFAGCRDALELDGGGSTTMWIDAEPFGGVVNYPTDNGEFDHEGARSLRLAVLIMETD